MSDEQSPEQSSELYPVPEGFPEDKWTRVARDIDIFLASRRSDERRAEIEQRWGLPLDKLRKGVHAMRMAGVATLKAPEKSSEQ